jgi:type IV secretion system protein VirB6
MNSKKTSRWWISLVLISFVVAVLLPTVTYSAVSAQNKGTQPTPASLTPANCLHVGTCSYSCPGGTNQVPSHTNLCCPNNTTYSTATNLCESSSTNKGGGGGNGGGTSSNNTQAPQLVCTLSLFNPLTWLICPLVSAAQGAIEGLTNGIDSLLTINTAEIFNTSSKTGSGFYQAWNTFRIFGAGLIVIAGLIMLIAQAAGAEIIDAYTIHKVLPRILIAVIFITLSWPLLNFAISLTNDIGTGIRAIIYTPFQGIGTTVRVDGGAASVGALVGTATFLTLGLLGIASFMLTALLAVFVGFIVLFLRQVIIQMLVIFAPLAIACYVLPGTQKAWGFWKDAFISMLIVFPIISAMIAMGRVFSVVMYNNRTGGVPTFVNEIGAFIVYFLPYFLLPAAFRWAGSAMATIGGMVNDRHRGAFDRLKNFRKTSAANNAHAMKVGNRFRSDNAFANRFNAATRGAANIGSAGFNPTKMRSRFQAGTSLGKEQELHEYMEKNAAFNSIKGNDDYLQATMGNMAARDKKTGKYIDAVTGKLFSEGEEGTKIFGGTNEQDQRRYLSAMGYGGRDLEQGVAAIRDAKRGTSNDVFSAAAVVANASTGTGWKDGGVTEMMESINDSAGGDRHMATNMLAQMRGAAGQSGRLDLAGSSFGKQAQQLGRMYDEKKTTGAVSDDTKLDVTHELHQSVLETKGANDFARSRGQAVEHLSHEMLYDLKKAHARVNAAQVGTEEHTKASRSLAQKYASVANFHDSLNHMSPENAKLISDNVLDQKIDGKSVFAGIEDYRKSNNQDYLHTRKDYDARQYREQGGPPAPDEG